MEQNGNESWSFREVNVSETKDKCLCFDNDFLSLHLFNLIGLARPNRF